MNKPVLILLVLFSNTSRLFGGQWTNELIAHYRFETNGLDSLGRSPPYLVVNVSRSLTNGNYVPSFVLAEPPFTNGVLFINGRYEPNASVVNYLGTAPIQELDYNSFTVAMDFYPMPPTRSGISMTRWENRLDTWTRGRYSRWAGVDPIRFNTINLLTGGYGYRWIGFNRSEGYLNLTLNNQAFVHRFDDIRVKPGRWHRLICSFDLRQRKILTMFDGRLLEPIVLPADFKLEVIGSSFEDSDREFTFSNMSNGSMYYGYAAHLKLFRRALTAAELAEVSQQSEKEIPKFPPPTNEFTRISAVAVVSGLVIGIVGWRWLCGRRRRRAMAQRS